MFVLVFMPVLVWWCVCVGWVEIQVSCLHAYHHTHACERNVYMVVMIIDHFCVYAV